MSEPIARLISKGGQKISKRICRLWRNAGLKVPYRKRKKPTHNKTIAMGILIIPAFL